MSEEIRENIKAYYIGSDIDKVLDYIQQKENIIKEAKKNNQYIIDVINDIEDGKRLIELLSKTNEILENGGKQ